MQQLAEANFSLLLDSGFLKPFSAITLHDKTTIIDVVALHYVILRTKGELDQFSEGLGTCGVQQYIEKYPDLLREFFCIGQVHLTAGNYNKILEFH